MFVQPNNCSKTIVSLLPSSAIDVLVGTTKILMVDTFDLVHGVYIVLAGKGEERVPVDDNLQISFDVSRECAKKEPSVLCNGPRYNVVAVYTKSLSVVKPRDK